MTAYNLYNHMEIGMLGKNSLLIFQMLKNMGINSLENVSEVEHHSMDIVFEERNYPLIGKYSKAFKYLTTEKEKLKNLLMTIMLYNTQQPFLSYTFTQKKTKKKTE